MFVDHFHSIDKYENMKNTGIIGVERETGVWRLESWVDVKIGKTVALKKKEVEEG